MEIMLLRQDKSLHMTAFHQILMYAITLNYNGGQLRISSLISNEGVGARRPSAWKVHIKIGAPKVLIWFFVLVNNGHN